MDYKNRFEYIVFSQEDAFGGNIDTREIKLKFDEIFYNPDRGVLLNCLPIINREISRGELSLHRYAIRFRITAITNTYSSYSEISREEFFGKDTGWKAGSGISNLPGQELL